MKLESTKELLTVGVRGQCYNLYNNQSRDQVRYQALGQMYEKVWYQVGPQVQGKVCVEVGYEIRKY